MKIAFFLEIYPKFSETFILNEIYQLEKLGVKGVIFSLYHSQEREIQPIVRKINSPVFYFPKKVIGCQLGEMVWFQLNFLFSHPFSYFKTFLWLIKKRSWSAWRTFFKIGPISALVKKENPDVLYAHFARESTLAAFLISRLVNLPFAFMIHAVDLYVSPHLLPEKIQAARLVLVRANSSKKYLINQFPLLPKDKIKIFRTGIDLNFFSSQRIQKKKRLTIISVARLAEKKGLKYLIEACHILNQKKLNLQCLIVGNGPEKEELTRMVKRYKLGKKIKLVGSLPHGKRLKRLVSSSHVFVLPCIIAKNKDRDIIPNSLLEAMALKIPIVSTPVGGIKEAVPPGAGILVSPGDSVALAEAILRIKTMRKGTRLKMIQKARNKIESDFDLEKETRRLLALLRTIKKKR